MPEQAQPSKKRQDLLRSVYETGATLGLVVLILTAAEVAARNEWVSYLILPAPSDVARALFDGMGSGLYLEHMWDTLWPTAVGFGVGSILAIAIGGILGSSPSLERIVMPIIIAIQSTPKIAIAPLIVLWLGFGPTSKIVIVGVVAFFPVLVNTIQGMRLRERDRVELMDALGATRYQLFRYMRLPSAVPYIFAGLHVGIIFALMGAVVAEFVGTQSGIGYLMLQQKALFNVPAVWALLFMLMVIGLSLNLLMRWLEKRVAPWAQDTASEQR